METVNRQSMTIDIRKRSIISTPQFIQNDTNVLDITVLDNGEPANLEGVGQIIVNFKGANSKVVSRNAVAEGNVVSHQIGTQEMVKAGTGEMEVQFINEDQRISTLRFKVHILAEIGFGTEGEDAPTLMQELTMKGDYAQEQGDYAKQAADTSITTWLSPVADYSAVEAIESPVLGDTVQTNDNGYVYRFDGTEWVNTQQYGATALANVNAQLAETEQQAIKPVINHVDKNIIVSFMDDDGNPRLLTTIKPIHEQENVPLNICVIGSALPYSAQSVSISDCKQMKALGWNVANHTQNHVDMTAYSYTQAESEILPVKNVLKDNGLDHDIIVYPYGGYNKNVLDAVRKYNKIGISTTEGINIAPINTFALKRVSGIGETGVTLTSLKTTIDNAPNGSWIIFKGHTGYDAYTQQQTLDDYRALIQYIKSKGIEIVTINEGLKRKGNIVDVGTEYQKFQVSYDGKVRLNNTFEDYSFNNSTPVTYFPYGESVTYFNNNEIVGKGFPVGDNGGTVTTVRIRMDKYVSEDASYQTFQPYYENTLYRRRWINGTSSWGSWDKIAEKITGGNAYQIITTVDTFTGNTAVSSFDNNKVTEFVSTIGTPNGVNGTFTTHKVRANGYDYQTFKEYNTFNMYLRYATLPSGAWSPWKQIQLI